MASMTRKGQVYSVGNYLMTGKVFGKGHFARVEEATHRIIGRKVAIKIIDLTLIKEEYARRNLHREPRVMARLRHPCIAALYETMMHGPRLYVVMEAAGGGDLCAHVLAHGGRARAAPPPRGLPEPPRAPPAPPRGLPEPRARALAAQLVSAVRHMHARGVVHRDLKMENIMLDSTKQFIKIVDFGLSNMWSGGAALRTPCGSLEYAAPELFVDGRRYGPEVDLWSVSVSRPPGLVASVANILLVVFELPESHIAYLCEDGVIVYGMVLGSLPFTGSEREASGERAQLRAAIARGLTRRQRAQLQALSPDCKAFIQHLLEPNVELRMKIEEAARHRWIKRPGMRMKTHPLPPPEPKLNREIYKQIAELSGQPVLEVVSSVKAEPFGAAAGMYNIKAHLLQLQARSGAELLWAAGGESRPPSPPAYPAPPEPRRATTPSTPAATTHTLAFADFRQTIKTSQPLLSQPKFTQMSPAAGGIGGAGPGGRKPGGARTALAHGDGPHRRLPSIDEHAHADAADDKRPALRSQRAAHARRSEAERLHSCPERPPDARREFYRRAGDGNPSWRAAAAPAAAPPSATRILLQTHATSIKRASLGNIVSPHSSSNSHCKSDRAMPVGWFSTKASIVKDSSHFQRLRRTAPMK